MNKKMTDEQRKAMFAKQKSGKTYKREYTDYKTLKNQHHKREPSWTAKHDVKGDIKDMHRRDNPEYPTDHSKDVQLYKKRLEIETDKEYIRQNKKQSKKQEKSMKKQEKQMLKQAKSDYEEDQKQESSERQEIQDTGGG